MTEHRIHLKSLQSTLNENSIRAQMVIKIIVAISLVLALTTIITITQFLSVYFPLSLTFLCVFYLLKMIKKLHHIWQTNQKIQQKIQTLKNKKNI